MDKTPREIASDVLINLGASALGTLLVISLGLGWYLLVKRRREKRWLVDHAPMLWVYFRNVDGRCERIRRRVTASDPSFQMIRLQLIKLVCDLEALERLAQMWARRIAALPIWYPQYRLMSQMLDESDALAVALRRHIVPALALLDAASKSEQEMAELNAYLGYFGGGSDRLWGRPSLKDGTTSAARDLAAQRCIGLRERMVTLHRSLLSLFDSIRPAYGKSVDRLWIWDNRWPEDDRQSACGIWFNPSAEQEV